MRDYDQKKIENNGQAKSRLGSGRPEARIISIRD